MKKEINRTLGNSLRCILPSFWWKRLLGKMVDKIESAESTASSAMKMATLAGLEASDKQERLVSGSNIRTINNQSILGSGNITIEAGDGVEQIIFYATENDAYPLTAAEIAHNVESMQKQRTAFLNNTPVSFLVSVKGAGFQTCETPSFYLPSNNTDIPVGFYIVCGGSAQVMVTCNWDGTANVKDLNWIDTELSDTSKNPVQNKVVTKALGILEEHLTVHSEQISSLGLSMATKEELNAKQNTISDLETIRSGAEKGATALQSIPSEYVTESELTTKGYVTTSALNNKVDKVNGKQLSTEDFTSALRTKLEGLRNYDDTSIQNAVNSLTTQINTLVSGDASVAIENFNEIISFLNDIEDSESLDSIIANIEQQIANKQNIIIDLADIRNGAALGTTSLQEHQDISHLATKETVTNLTNDVLDNEEIYAAAVNDLNIRVVNTDSVLSTEISNRESLQTEFQTFKTQVTENEEVWATSLTDINSRLNTNYQHGEDTYATKNSLSNEIQTINTVITDNEEIIAATLTDLNAQIATLNAIIAGLTTRIETLENA